MTTVTDAEAIVQAIIGTPGTVLSQASYDALVNGIKAYRQAAILEGMEIMREAALAVVHCGCETDCEFDEAGRMIYNLDPAAIIAQHKRTKAMSNEFRNPAHPTYTGQSITGRVPPT